MGSLSDNHRSFSIVMCGWRSGSRALPSTLHEALVAERKPPFDGHRYGRLAVNHGVLAKEDAFGRGAGSHEHLRLTQILHGLRLHIPSCTSSIPSPFDGGFKVRLDPQGQRHSADMVSTVEHPLFSDYGPVPGWAILLVLFVSGGFFGYQVWKASSLS